MSKINTIKKILRNDKRQLPIALFNNIVHTGIFAYCPDEKFLKMCYRIRTGEKLNLEMPKTFCQKIQWLKLYDRKPEYINLVDKIKVKNYVGNIIGNQYIIPTLGVWSDFSEINFEALPDKFVLKCNHDSGSVVVCTDKNQLDWNQVKKKIEKGLHTDAFLWGREWPYKNVERKILAEEYLETEEYSDLVDYKFYCFNGTPQYCQVITNRSVDERIDFFDMNWKHQDFIGLTAMVKNSEKKINRPFNFDLMTEFCCKLSKNMKFVRIDFYEVNAKLYFGEITFYPSSGFGKFEPDIWNYKLGELIEI